MAARISSQDNHTCTGHIKIVCKRDDPLAYTLLDDLKERLKVNGYESKEEFEDDFDVDVNAPGAIIVMCVKSTNILHNVNDAIAGFEDKKVNKEMALVIMHEQHAEHDTLVDNSSDILNGRLPYDHLGEILDLTFTTKEKGFILEDNIEKMQRLDRFLVRTLGRSTCRACLMSSTTASCKLGNLQLCYDKNDKPSNDLLQTLLKTLVIKDVTVKNITDIEALNIDVPTIFLISESIDEESAENKLTKYINDKGFKKTAIIVLCNSTNADGVIDTNYIKSSNIHIIKLALSSIEYVGKIEDINDALNKFLINFKTEKSDAKSLSERWANWKRPSFPSFPSLPSLPSPPTLNCLPSFPSVSKKLGPVQVYCRRNDQTATDITRDLVSQLRKQKFDCNMKDINDLNHAEPAIVICFKTSRILANVSEGLVDIKSKLSDKKVLIILHLTDRDVETVEEAGADLLGGHADYRSLGMVLDLTYRNDEQKSRFCLNHNMQAFKKLESHLKRIA